MGTPKLMMPTNPALVGADHRREIFRTIRNSAPPRLGADGSRGSAGASAGKIADAAHM